MISAIARASGGLARRSPSRTRPARIGYSWQAPPQLFQPGIEPALDGPGRDFHGRGDLPQRQPSRVVQHHDIAERGRSLGVSLFGAQQTASEVERRIVGNASLKVVGRLDAAEAERSEYGFLTRVGRVRASLLQPGSMIVSQPEIPMSILLRFPFPSHEVRLNKKHRARLHGVGSRVYGPGQYVQGGGLLRRGYDIAPTRSGSSAVYDEQKKTPRSPQIRFREALGSRCDGR